MLALQNHQQQQPQKSKTKPLHGKYGSQTVARSKNIVSSHNSSRLLTNNTFVQQYCDPKLLVSTPDSRSCIYQQQQNQMKQLQQYHYHQPHESLMSAIEKGAMLNRPLCRCRVMYLGSSVPHVTKNGLHGIQEPLKHLYPEEKFSSSKLIQQQAIYSTALRNHNTLPNNTTIDISHLSSSLGIDSWLSVWSNGLLLENVDEFGREIKRFFFIESLHYCAAVRFFDTTTLMSDQRNTTRISSSTINYNKKSNCNDNNNSNGSENGDLNNYNTAKRNKNFSNNKQQQQGELESTASFQDNGEPADEIARQQKQRKNAIRFLPLDAPLFQCPGMLDANHPPMFASIMRRTTGIKVLECHAFICRRDAAANALVRCCTHAYADFLNAKRLSIELGQAMPYNQYSKGATINGMSLSDRTRARRRATSSVSRMVKTETNINSPHYEVANNFNHSSDSNTNHIGPNSTGASNEDNSLEVSSEDNYAIISKHHHNQPVLDCSDWRQQSQPKDERRWKRDKKSKVESEKNDLKCASTKSLYYDFTPETTNDILPEPEPCCTVGRESRLGEAKLSHSLDLLNRDFQANCCVNSSDSNDIPIKYSIVKNKRHSKSMQNLDGPFEFSASAARSSSRLRKERRSRRSVAQEIEKSRKTASYQDMMRNISSSSDMIPQQQHQASPGSHTTKPACYAESNIVLDCDYPEVEARSVQKAIPPTESMHNSSRGKKSGSKRAQSQQSLSRSRKSRDVQNQNQHQYMEYQQQQQQLRQNVGQLIYQQPHHLPIYPQPSPPINLGCSSLYLPAPPARAPACYMGLVANNFHQPMYATPSSGLIYEQMGHGNPYLAQSPPIPSPLTPHMSHPAYMHPNQFLQMNNAALIQPNKYNGGDIYHSQTMMLPKKSQKAKSSLARFRCLSPPLNFITHTNQSVVTNESSSNRNSHQSAPTTQMSAVATNKIGSNNLQTNGLPSTYYISDDNVLPQGNKQVLDNNVIGSENVNGSFKGDDNHDGSIAVERSQEEGLNVDGVVSAEPSFISSAAAARANVREKKLSWIKRLSLTMISGSATPTNGLEGELQVKNKLSSDPSGNQRIVSRIKDDNVLNKQRMEQDSSCENQVGSTDTMRKTKRKSRLFSGSLTLGRKKQQQHTKLQITHQQQQKPPPPSVVATTTAPNTSSAS